jgi:hypothetical protein
MMLGAPEVWHMNQRWILRLYPKMGLSLSGSAETWRVSFAYPKILSCMTRMGLGPVRENLSVTD